MYRYVLRFWKIAYGCNIAVSTLSRQVRNMLIALLLHLYINKTMFCRAKNKLKRGVRIKSDLRKSRYDLLKRANDYVKEVPSIKFFYAGVNCRLKAKFNDENREGHFFYFRWSLGYCRHGDFACQFVRFFYYYHHYYYHYFLVFSYHLVCEEIYLVKL